MRSFIDKEGFEWSLDVTAGVLMDIQDELKINLLDSPDQLPDQISKMVGILWITCREQCKAQGLTPKDFAHRLGGDVLQVAIDKWMEDWAGFFAHLSPARAEMLRGLWDKAKQMEKAQAALIGKVCSSISTDWPESATSTPGP